MAYHVIYNLKLDLKCRSAEERETIIALGRENSLSQKVHEILSFCAEHQVSLDELREAWQVTVDRKTLDFAQKPHLVQEISSSESKMKLKALKATDLEDMTESNDVNREDNINRYIIGHPDYQPEYHDKSEFPGIDEAINFDLTDDDPELKQKLKSQKKTLQAEAGALDDNEDDDFESDLDDKTLSQASELSNNHTAVPQVKVKRHVVHNEIPDHLKGGITDKFKSQFSDAEIDNAFNDLQNDPESTSSDNVQNAQQPNMSESVTQSSGAVLAADLNAAWDEEEVATDTIEQMEMTETTDKTAVSVSAISAEDATAEKTAVNVTSKSESAGAVSVEDGEEIDLDEINAAMLEQEDPSEVDEAELAAISEKGKNGRKEKKSERPSFFSRLKGIMKCKPKAPEI